MARPPRSSPPAGWDYTASGKRAFDEEVERFEEALNTTWIQKTRLRGSTSLDAPECREASNFLLTNLPEHGGLKILRVSAAVIILFAGLAISEGWNAAPRNIVLISIAALLAVVMVWLQETVLHKK